MGKNITKASIIRELRSFGLKVTPQTLEKLFLDGLFEMDKTPSGNLLVTSRKEAEKLKRVVWIYHRGTEPYPEDVDGN